MQIEQVALADFNQVVADRVAAEITGWRTECPLGKDDCRFRLGLTGGTTARGVYEALASDHAGIDWPGVDLTLTDERNVALDHESSNFGMIKETLLDPLNLQPEQVAHFAVNEKEPQLKMDLHLTKAMRQRTPLFNLLILGVGPDGHVGSIFPNHGCTVSDGWACKTQTDRFAVGERFTLSLAALSSAEQVFLILKGVEKKEILGLLEDNAVGLPVQQLIHRVGVDRVAVFFGE